MIFRRLFYAFTVAVVTLTAATSCGGRDDDDDIVLGQKGPDDGSGNLGVNTPPSGYRLRLEVPKLSANGIFVQHSTRQGMDSVMNYCLEYDAAAMHSRWVAFRFDAITRAKNTGRSSEPFADDPDLPSACRIGSGGFGSYYIDLDGRQQSVQTSVSSQFDRGHLCASADRYLSTEANEQTFYMSNMSPQMSKFNSPYWSSYENYVQTRGRMASFADTLYVVKGGTIAHGQILGYVRRANGAMVTVPKYYFMALLKCKNNVYEAIAFWMEHKVYSAYVETSAPQSELAAHAISVDDLEQLTGIDFFHNLPDATEQQVEASVNLANWGLK